MPCSKTPERKSSRSRQTLDESIPISGEIGYGGKFSTAARLTFQSDRSWRTDPHFKIIPVPSFWPQEGEDDVGISRKFVRGQICEPATESCIIHLQVIRRRPSIKAPVGRRRSAGDDPKRFPLRYLYRLDVFRPRSRQIFRLRQDLAQPQFINIFVAQRALGRRRSLGFDAWRSRRLGCCRGPEPRHSAACRRRPAEVPLSLPRAQTRQRRRLVD